jgi:hypothetical protein
MFRRCFFIIFLLIFLNGCGHKFTWFKKPQLSSEATKKAEIALLDVPLPNRSFAQIITAENNILPDDADISDAEIVVECTAAVSLQEIITFFEREMEHLGWQLVARSATVFSLIFEKPDAYCLIFNDSLLISAQEQVKRDNKKVIFKVIRFEKINGGYA